MPCQHPLLKQFSLVSWPIAFPEGHDRYWAEILFKSFQQEAIVSTSGMGRVVHSLLLSIQHFLCPPRRRPPSNSALKECFGEAVVACDMLESCSFRPLDSCQKRFLWVHKEVDLAVHPAVVLCLGRRCEEVSLVTSFWKPGSFSQGQQAGSMFHNHRGRWKLQ